MGLPVVITDNISDDSYIIRDNEIGAVLGDLTQKSYVEAVNKMDDLLKQDKLRLQKRIRSIAERYRNYEIAEEIYKQFYK